ncbi:hypothetical protein [Adlercreutzia sp. ZJ138]|uniref:hypothetical protein n=1 Tax=Adlercreutzia sp. ZJ138 TaxID=2709405 RepID=UPI0013E9C4B2|nr:hypothetical protein [Adlercreutzia sp. ZJ138]
MKATYITKKKTAIIIVVVVLVLLIGIMLLAMSCATEPGDEIEQIDIVNNGTTKEGLVEEADLNSDDEVSLSDPATDSGSNVDTSNAETTSISADQPAAIQQDVAYVSNANEKPSASSDNNDNSSSLPPKRWVEETQRVWVEDRAAWSEQVPVYGTEEVSVCNICGEDITGNTSAHGKAHMLAGEGSGHHSEVLQTVEGYRSVEHPAEGHWETKVVGGHWE